MGAGSDAYGRPTRSRPRLRATRRPYRASLAAVVRDFEGRDRHLTGVPIADTALMLEWLAQRRGMAAGIANPVLPITRAGAAGFA